MVILLNLHPYVNSLVTIIPVDPRNGILEHQQLLALGNEMIND